MITDVVLQLLSDLKTELAFFIGFIFSLHLLEHTSRKLKQAALDGAKHKAAVKREIRT